MSLQRNTRALQVMLQDSQLVPARTVSCDYCTQVDIVVEASSAVGNPDVQSSSWGLVAQVRLRRSFHTQSIVQREMAMAVVIAPTCVLVFGLGRCIVESHKKQDESMLLTLRRIIIGTHDHSMPVEAMPQHSAHWRTLPDTHVRGSSPRPVCFAGSAIATAVPATR